MAKEVKVPKLGDNIDSAEITQVLVAVGDTLEAGQGLIELESDKATVEVPAPEAGVVKELRVASGDTVSEGQVILVLEAGEAESDTEQDASAQEAPPAEAADAEQQADPPAETEASGNATGGSTEVRVPKLGDNVDSAEITRVLVAVGDTIEAGQGLIELESDKASVEVPSPATGTVQELRVAEGDTISVDQVILVLSGGGASAAKTASKPAAKTEAKTEKAPVRSDQPAPGSAQLERPQGFTEPYEHQERAQEALPSPERVGDPAPAAPSVRRFARELGVDVHAVPGTGPGGRISKDDVKAYVKTRLQQPAASPAAAAGSPAVAVPPMPDFSRFGEIKTEKISNVRRATARQMSLSWSQIPHVTQFDSADITGVDAFRKSHGKAAEKAGGKLTVTAILLKICALALKRFPQFNASIDLANEQIVYKQYTHIGVAVDTPRGLVVPVLRDVNRKGLIELAVELGSVGQKARDRKLGPDDMQGAGFTISNLGGLGTTYFTPIVNWPEVAILGVGRASQQPVWQDNAFVPRLIMPLSISYDHRLIDGADAARFLRFIAEALENPLMLLMEGDL
ncbi:MAG: dihydrolipoyllysine-residue acetyltransferase [Candidatus Sericytochromatia bacterium]